MPWVKKDLCALCKVCLSACPVGAIVFENGKIEINQNTCIKCGKCLKICPRNAIRPNNESSELKGHRYSR